jgi:hypothetical protein
VKLCLCSSICLYSMATDIFTFTLSKVRTAGSHLDMCVHGRQYTCLPHVTAEIFGIRGSIDEASE